MFRAERLVTLGDDVAVSSEQHRLLYRIAQAYYVDGLTQKQIANRFGLSRPKVSRLLRKGRDNGIISITLTPPPNGMADLEHALEHRIEHGVWGGASERQRRRILKARKEARAVISGRTR